MDPKAHWQRYLRLQRQIDIWHDRAVFHFLTEDSDRQAYLDSVRDAVTVGGYIILATFGPSGPDRCSGLSVERYDANKMGESLGSEFELAQGLEKQHVTPGGAAQQFTYAVFRRLR